MSTVEGFDLHVYCDALDCTARDGFSGRDRADAVRRAKRSGWHISNKASANAVIGGKAAACPKHNPYRVAPQAPAFPSTTRAFE